MIRSSLRGLLSALCLLAQDPLTEERAVELAVERDLRVAALRSGIRAVQLTPHGIGLLSSPQVRYGITDVGTDLNDPGRARNNVGLAWSPPRIGSFGDASETIGARVSEASADAAAARSKAAAETRLTFRTAILLEEQVRLAAEVISLRERVSAGVTEQARAGLATQLERDAAELSLAEARAAAARIRSERLVYLVRLANLTGLAAASLTLAPTAEALRFSPPELDAGKLRKDAIAARPELKSAEARCRQIEIGQRSMRRELYPWFSSVQMFRRTNRNTGTPDWGFQIGVDVPLFRWRENEMPAAAAKLEQCRTSKGAIERSIANEIDELVARMQAAARDLVEHDRSLLSLGARQIESTRAVLAARQTDIVQPLLAELRMVALKQSYVNRLMEFRALEAGLNQALGN